MGRRRHKASAITPAEGLRAAMAAMRAEMESAPPARAGALAEKLAALALKLAAEEARTQNAPEAEFTREHARQMLFDEEAQRLIHERALEYAKAMVRGEG